MMPLFMRITCCNIFSEIQSPFCIPPRSNLFLNGWDASCLYDHKHNGYHYIPVPFINGYSFPCQIWIKISSLKQSGFSVLHVHLFVIRISSTTSFRQALFQIHPIFHSLQTVALPLLALIHSYTVKIEIHFSCQTGWMVIRSEKFHFLASFIETDNYTE